MSSKKTKSILLSFFLASRPKTLIAGLCPVLVGASYAFYYRASLDWFYFYVLVLASICIQIATNFFNDALDSDQGRDGERRLGPERAASTGALSSRLLKRAALGLLVCSFFLGLALAFKVGFWIFLIGLPALFLAYLYTGSRFALSTTGTADIFVLLYFGIIPVWTTNYVLSGESSLDSIWTGLQLGLLANALLLINNLRDVEEDTKNSKKTLVVRFGRCFGLFFLAVCLFSPYFINFFITPVFFRAGLWTTPLLVLSGLIFYKVCFSSPSKKYNKYLGMTALNLLLFSLVFSVGVLSS